MNDTRRGRAVFVDDDHPMNLCLPIRRKETDEPRERTPELQAIRLALWRLKKWEQYE